MKQRSQAAAKQRLRDTWSALRARQNAEHNRRFTTITAWPTYYMLLDHETFCVFITHILGTKVFIQSDICAITEKKTLIVRNFLIRGLSIDFSFRSWVQVRTRRRLRFKLVVVIMVKLKLCPKVNL